MAVVRPGQGRLSQSLLPPHTVPWRELLPLRGGVAEPPPLLWAWRSWVGVCSASCHGCTAGLCPPSWSSSTNTGVCVCVCVCMCVCLHVYACMCACACEPPTR